MFDKVTRHPRTLAALLLVVLALRPVGAAAQTETSREMLGPAIAVEIARGLEATDGPQRELWLAEIDRFYRARDFAPLWLEPDGIRDKARELVEILQASAEHGLRPADYDTKALAGLIAADLPADRPLLEARLSIALVEYASDLGSGRVIPREVDEELHIYPRDIEVAALLERVAAAERLAPVLAGYAPQTDEYGRLKNALADYRRLAAQGGWPPFPEGETLKAGMTDSRVADLRAQLRLRGDLPEPDETVTEATPADLFDPGVERAVRRFQDRHGLTPDGVVGPLTSAALNVPVELRIKQMLLNMERRRWMNDDLGERYVFVNLADFELKLVEYDDTVFDSIVQVGSRYHRTPVFSDEIEYIVLNPTWTVPPSIAARSILPKLQEDPGYLESNDFVVFSDWSGDAVRVDPAGLDWTAFTRQSVRGLKFRQMPGEGNALGRLKIMLPNRFDIYLHDTPSKGLFERTERTFSSGCIRVAKPRELAARLLRPDPQWSLERIDAVIESAETRVVRLPEPVQVHITYLTAWVNKDGSVYFRPDVYDRDEKLAAALGIDGL